MRQDIIFNVTVDIGGRRLELSELLVRADLDDIRPNLSPDPWSVRIDDQSRERRKRFVDMLSANFAHALTDALFSGMTAYDKMQPAQHAAPGRGKSRVTRVTRDGIEKMDFPQ